MAKLKRPEIQSANLTIEKMRAGIPKLERRIKDLETFNINTIRRRWDPVVDALTEKVNGTLQEILGHGTVEYNEYHLYSLDTLPTIMGGGEESLPRVHEGYREGIERAILKLKTLKELFEERVIDAEQSNSEVLQERSKTAVDTRKIFIVHGRDEGTKETVARYITKLDLNPIILHEQPNQGKTVIEKFETHSGVEFAIVLFTPDDIGYPKDNPNNQKPRARQNVVLELGFFLGTLGRNRVCVLFKGEVEIPSDYSGVLYIPLDDAGTWRLNLAREMKSVGMDIDLNKAF